jgi:hypothetical protein
VVENNSLPFVSDEKSSSVCDSCLRAKCHQLPYPKSTSVAHAPFELIFSDVWGAAQSLVGRLRTMCGSRTGGWSLTCVMSD